MRSAIEICRSAHRNPPGDVRFPARVAQVRRDRGEPVELVAPDVRKAVPVAVGAKAQRNRGHELRKAGGTRPASLQAPARHALIHQLQRGNELAFEEVAAAAIIAEAGERLQQVGAAGDQAIACFMAVNREQDGRVDALSRLDRAKASVQVRIIALPAADERRGDVRAQIGRERSDDTAAGPRDRLGAFEVDYTLVDLETRDIGLDRRFADALLPGERGEPDLVGVPGAR